MGKNESFFSSIRNLILELASAVNLQRELDCLLELEERSKKKNAAKEEEKKEEGRKVNSKKKMYI